MWFSESSAVGWWYETVEAAFRLGASDIHFGVPKYEGESFLAYRIEGEIQVQTAPESAYAERLLTALKTLARLSLLEKKRPLEGHFMAPLSGGALERLAVRVSVFPLKRGSKATLRLFRAVGERRGQALLGGTALPGPALCAYQQALLGKQGLVLVSGSTGSGKTTLLYEGLSWLSREQHKLIYSVEDPVESWIPGIFQAEVRASSDFSFHDALKGLLRQDPDVVLIGEIRDEETALAALRACQSGHLVLSSLHTPSLFFVPKRLEWLGWPREELAALLNTLIGLHWEGTSEQRSLTCDLLGCSEAFREALVAQPDPFALTEAFSSELKTEVWS